MKLVGFLVLAMYAGLFPSGLSKNITSRPAAVDIGAVFSFNSTIGKVVKVAMKAAINDVNSDPNVLKGTKLNVRIQDSNRSLFVEIIEGLQFMGSDVVAILGPQSSTIAHVLSHVANELQVPLVSFATDPTLSSLQYPFFVQAIQNDAFQMQAISEIVDYFQWKQVIAVFTDNDYGRNGVSVLGDKLAERRCKISYKAALRPGANRTEIIDLLVRIALMESRIIVVHADLLSGLLIFSVAQYLEMLGNGYAWIATDWLSSRIDTYAPLDQESMNTIQGVVTLRQHTPDSEKKRKFISRWSKLVKEQNDTFGLNTYGLYAYDSVWIVAKAIDAFFDDGGLISFSNDTKLRDVGGALHLDAMSIFGGGQLLLDKVKKSNFVGLTGPILFDSDGYLVNPAYDILNIVGTGMRTIGYWSNHTGLSVAPPEILYSKPSNRSNANQKLYSVIWPGETTVKPRGWVFPNNGKELKIGIPNKVYYREFVSKSPKTGLITGFCIEVFTSAVNLLPYPVPSKFIPFGNGHENPKYDDLVYRVASGEFDAAVGDIAIVTNRTKIVDFTQPYTESGLVILAPVKEQRNDAWDFLQPFTWGMWLVTGLFFILVGFVVWILEHRINKDFRGPPKRQIVTILWFSFSTLFFAHRESTVSSLGRFVLIIWLFVVLIIQSSYTASLTSILTVQQLSSPIKGIESLISSSEPIGYQLGSFSGNYLNEELHIPQSRLKPLNSPEDYARSLELGPHNGGVAAIIAERPYMELFLSSHCKYKIVGSEFTKNGWGFAFPRDSPLAVDLSTAILQLSENGDLQRIHDKWLTTKACSSDTEQLESSQLQLHSFWGLFLICGLACVIALLIYFYMILREFIRHVSQEESDAIGATGSSISSRSFNRFLSFVDSREDRSSSSSSRREISNTTATANGSQTFTAYSNITPV